MLVVHLYMMGNVQMPKINEFANKCEYLGIDVQICIIVRDQNINCEQQRRVRGGPTLPTAMEYYKKENLWTWIQSSFLGQ